MRALPASKIIQHVAHGPALVAPPHCGACEVSSYATVQITILHKLNFQKCNLVVRRTFDFNIFTTPGLPIKGQWCEQGQWFQGQGKVLDL